MPERAAPGLRKIVVATAIAIAGLLLAFVVLTGKPKPAPADTVTVLKPVVAVLEARPSAVSLPVKTQGTVEALRAINLVAQVGGKVQSVANNFVDGAFFRSGEQLLSIEPDDYEFAIARADENAAEKGDSAEKCRSLRRCNWNKSDPKDTRL